MGMVDQHPHTRKGRLSRAAHHLYPEGGVWRGGGAFRRRIRGGRLGEKQQLPLGKGGLRILRRGLSIHAEQRAADGGQHRQQQHPQQYCQRLSPAPHKQPYHCAPTLSNVVQGMRSGG